MNIIKRTNMKKYLLVIKFIYITILFSNAQILSKSQLDSISMNLPLISKDISFNNIKESKYISFKLYSRLIKNYENIDSIFAIDQNGRKYKGAWSGYIEGDSSIVNIDNTDKNGKPIPGLPNKLVYSNKISILGMINIDRNFTLIPIKVESYSFFVIHLFSFNSKGKLVSVIPIGKVEKDKDNKNWLVIQNGKINCDNSIFASYLAEAYVELKYVLQDGHFKVVNRKVEE